MIFVHLYKFLFSYECRKTEKLRQINFKVRNRKMLHTLPKEMLIEIIYKQARWENFSTVELYEIRNKINEVLLEKQRDRLYNVFLREATKNKEEYIEFIKANKEYVRKIDYITSDIVDDIVDDIIYNISINGLDTHNNTMSIYVSNGIVEIQCHRPNEYNVPFENAILDFGLNAISLCKFMHECFEIYQEEESKFDEED